MIDIGGTLVNPSHIVSAVVETRHPGGRTWAVTLPERLAQEKGLI